MHENVLEEPDALLEDGRWRQTYSAYLILLWFNHSTHTKQIAVAVIVRFSVLCKGSVYSLDQITWTIGPWTDHMAYTEYSVGPFIFVFYVCVLPSVSSHHFWYPQEPPEAITWDSSFHNRRWKHTFFPSSRVPSVYGTSCHHLQSQHLETFRDQLPSNTMYM